MLKKIMLKIAGKKTTGEVGFFDLSSREQKKIIKEAARNANQDQRKLLDEYERKFGKLQTNTCE